MPGEGTPTGGQRTRGSPRRAGEGSGPRLRRRDPHARTPQSPQPGPAPLQPHEHLPGRQPRLRGSPRHQGRGPAPLRASPAPRRPRLLAGPARPVGARAHPGRRLTGRRLGPRRPRRPLLLRLLPAASRGARLEPLRRGREELAASAASNTKFPSVVRAAPRKCHQRPFRSAPHFRPEPQSSACRLERPPRRREPRQAGGRPGASGAAPSGGGGAQVRARTPSAERGLPRSCFPGFRARARPPFNPVTLVAEGRDAGPCKPRALKARGSASRGLPDTHPLHSRSLSEGSSRCPIRGVTPARCPYPSLPTFPRGPKTARLPGNRLAPTRAIMSCSSLGSGNAAGLAASAPPAGDTVLQGTPLRQRTPPDAQNSASAESLLGLAARLGKGDTHYWEFCRKVLKMGAGHVLGSGP